MTIDMSQFLDTFYEESFEGLEVMESELLNLNIGDTDAETINTIFRAAHSIKGGSGTFGLTSVADFTHVMETLLDEMRDGVREITQNAVNILLESVDVLREMLTALRSDAELDHQRIANIQKQLDHLLVSAGDAEDFAAAPAIQPAQNDAVTEQPPGWQINFKPFPSMLQTGNDPVRMFRELSQLGEFSARADLSGLPGFEHLSAEDSYIAWQISVRGDIDKSAIEEVFEWVDGDCELEIIPLHGSQAADVSVIDDDEASLPLDTELLEKSFALISPQAETLVERFYTELFRRFPAVAPLFESTSPAEQQKKLLAALKLVVNNLRKPQSLRKALLELGRRHQGYGTVAAHYDAVIDTLLSVMQEVTGSDWSERLDSAWRDALELVADIMKSAYEEMPGAVAGSTPEASQNVEPQARQSPVTKGKTATPDNVAKEKKKTVSSESSSIRVSIDKIDDLINMMGELVITQSMLSQLGESDEFRQSHIEKLRDGLAQLERNTREMQENIMRIRMLPISFAFQRFPRLVHDLSGKLNKKIELKMSGEHTELDKTVMEKIGDPLVHLVRNSLDHGIEEPAVRVANGKPETGIIQLNAFHEGGNIVIEITDDGAGLNKEKILQKAKQNNVIADDDVLTDEQVCDLIFNPGFSTAEEVSEVSGRGVGMDVVRKNIRALGGTVDVKTQQGQGSTFTIRLPLTLAILDGQSVRVGSEIYILPLISIIESIQVSPELVNGVAGRAEVYKLRDEYIPVVKLSEIFNAKADAQDLQDGLLVVVEGEGKKIALFVDDLLGQQQVVIKSLETNFRKVDGISGATILGDGTVALILDIVGLINLSKNGNYYKKPRLVSDASGVAA